jgi:anti-sigma factor RsiW
MTEPPDSTPTEHISDEDLAAFLAHGLLPQKEQEVITHLAECSRCRTLVALLESSKQSVREPDEPLR